MRVLKFGGKSLATYEKVQNICKFIKKTYKNDKKIVIIVSAMGKTTDELIELGNQFNAEKINKREQASLISTGEIISAALFSMCLNSMDVPAKSLSAHDLDICTFGDYDDSKIYYINKQKISCVIDKNVVAVVAGFQGINKNGEITTLGRGGSDTTAVAIASLFGVDAEIYSDFDGVYHGDPRVFDFKKVDKLNYGELISMAQGGSKVMAERATQLAMNFETDIILKSSAEPYKVGTKVSNFEKSQITLSTKNNLCKITITYPNEVDLRKIIKHTLSPENSQIFDLSIGAGVVTFLVLEQNLQKTIAHLSKKLNLSKKI